MPIETVYATSHIAGDFTNPANAVGSTTGTWAGDVNVNSNYTSRWAMGDPVDPLTPGATQTFRVLARKGSNSGTPSIQINIWINGTLVHTGPTHNVSSTTGTLYSAPVTAGTITDRTQVEVEVIQTSAGGSPSARNSAQVDYIVWEADTTPPASLSRTAADSAGASDAVVGSATKARTSTDAVVTADAATRTSSSARSGTDATSVGDVATRQVNRSRTGVDTAGASDAATQKRILARTGTEALTTTDAGTRIPTFRRSGADTTSASDTVTRSGTFITRRTSADTTSIGDAPARSGVFARYNPRRSA